MISGYFSSFSSFIPILVLVEKAVRLFCALSGLIMSMSSRTTNKTSLNFLGIGGMWILPAKIQYVSLEL